MSDAASVSYPPKPYWPRLLRDRKELMDITRLPSRGNRSHRGRRAPESLLNALISGLPRHRVLGCIWQEEPLLPPRPRNGERGARGGEGHAAILYSCIPNTCSTDKSHTQPALPLHGCLPQTPWRHVTRRCTVPSVSWSVTKATVSRRRHVPPRIAVGGDHKLFGSAEALLPSRWVEWVLVWKNLG